MGSKEIGLLFMFLFFHFYSFASSSPLQETLPSDFVREINLGDKGTNAHSKSGIDDSDNVKSGIKHGSKLGHGFSPKGGDGGQSTESGNNPGSRSPVYSAGAANNHHPVHHGSGNCNQNCIGLSTIIATTMVSLVQLYITFRYG